MEAVYHTAIVVYGKEYYFGGGMSGSGITELTNPATTTLGKFQLCLFISVPRINSRFKRLFYTTFLRRTWESIQINTFLNCSIFVNYISGEIFGLSWLIS